MKNKHYWKVVRVLPNGELVSAYILGGKYQIKTNGRDHYLAVVSALWSLDFRPAPMHDISSPSQMVDKWATSYPVIVVYTDTRSLSGNSEAHPQYGEVVTLEELLDKICKKDSITVKLNDGYSAVVTKDTIKVGCQTFPTEVLDKLVNARNLVR